MHPSSSSHLDFGCHNKHQAGTTRLVPLTVPPPGSSGGGESVCMDAASVLLDCMNHSFRSTCACCRRSSDQIVLQSCDRITVIMIRRGKTEGWLRLPSEAFLPWAMLNEIDFTSTVPGNIAGRGGALLAKEPLDATSEQSSVLLRVPKDLILSLERVQDHAKVDKDLREILESLGSFGRVSTYATFLSSATHDDAILLHSLHLPLSALC